jgi:hypothetical protein
VEIFFSRLVKVSIELLTGFRIRSGKIPDQREFAKRLGRILVSDFTTGTWNRFVSTDGHRHFSTLANGTLVPAVGSSSNDGTAAGTNTMGSDDFVNLDSRR